MHTSHIDYDDISQVLKLGIYKAYNSYDMNYRNESYKDNGESIGFFAYMQPKAEGEVKKLIRNILKMNRKDYNIHEISTMSSDQPIVSLKGEKDMLLQDVIEDTGSQDDFTVLELKDEINSYTANLTDREKDMVYDYYINSKTQSEIANNHNVTQVQVCRVLKKALSKMKIVATDIHKGRYSIKKEIEEKMIKRKIDVNHAITYFADKLKEKKPLDIIIDEYCSSLEISKSELNYALHTTCPNSFNDIVDRYSEFEEEEIPAPKKGRERKTVRPQRTRETNRGGIAVAQDSTPVIKETITKVINPLEGLNVISLSLEFDSFKASLSPEGIELHELPESERLSEQDLISIRNDIDKLIEIRRNISSNILK